MSQPATTYSCMWRVFESIPAFLSWNKLQKAEIDSTDWNRLKWLKKTKKTCKTLQYVAAFCGFGLLRMPILKKNSLQMFLWKCLSVDAPPVTRVPQSPFAMMDRHTQTNGSNWQKQGNTETRTDKTDSITLTADVGDKKTAFAQIIHAH